MITNYSLAVTICIGFFHSAANMQGIISVITHSLMHHFINLYQQMLALLVPGTTSKGYCN